MIEIMIRALMQASQDTDSDLVVNIYTTIICELETAADNSQAMGFINRLEIATRDQECHFAVVKAQETLRSLLRLADAF